MQYDKINTNINTNESRHSEMGPVRKPSPENCKNYSTSGGIRLTSKSKLVSRNMKVSEPDYVAKVSYTTTVYVFSISDSIPTE